jgi:hypothetical protein
MRRERVAVAVGYAVLCGIILGTINHIVFGRPWHQIFVIWIPEQLIIMAPLYYFANLDRALKKFASWCARGFSRSSGRPVASQASVATDAATHGHGQPE